LTRALRGNIAVQCDLEFAAMVTGEVAMIQLVKVWWRSTPRAWHSYHENAFLFPKKQKPSSISHHDRAHHKLQK
jgi:hypothetical protein